MKLRCPKCKESFLGRCACDLDCPTVACLTCGYVDHISRFIEESGSDKPPMTKKYKQHLQDDEFHENPWKDTSKRFPADQFLREARPRFIIAERKNGQPAKWFRRVDGALKIYDQAEATDIALREDAVRKAREGIKMLESDENLGPLDE